MKDFASDYYEQKEIWKRKHPSELELNRILQTINLIPAGVESILDVGCGDGVITNRLAKIFPRVVGVDLSASALKQVKAETVRAGADRLPFSDNSFDLVLLSEVIEHLPVSIYENCLREGARVAKEYIVVTVPYREYLLQRFVRCPSCFCTYHRYRHVRSFDLEDLVDLFPGFRVVRTEFLGGKTERPYKWEVFIRQNLAGHYNPWPLAVCPQCGQKGTEKFKRGLLSWLLAIIGRIIPRKKTYHWIGAVYRKVKQVGKEDGEQIGSI
ncbi:MAG TPA: class I SAM-dependent methyltransferase [Clostridia bacterium]|nr:class I SAM-dependent methyltransferase [Clostridia bacterium]